MVLTFNAQAFFAVVTFLALLIGAGAFVHSSIKAATLKAYKDLSEALQVENDSLKTKIGELSQQIKHQEDKIGELKSHIEGLVKMIAKEQAEKKD